MKSRMIFLWLLNISPLVVTAFTPTVGVINNRQTLYNLKYRSLTCAMLGARNQRWELSSTQSDELPEPLAKEGDWGAYLDEDNTGSVYYFNYETGESLWEPPTKTFPDVSGSSSTKEKNNFFDGFGQQKKEVVAQDETESEDPKPLAKEGDWAAFLDEKDTGLVYYFNLKTGENLWEPPTKTFPTVNVNKKKSSLFNGLFPSTVKEEATEKDEIQTEVEKETPKKNAFPSFTNPFIGTPVKPLQIDSSIKILPHPAKASWGGEDAAFVQGRTFGVFDGVSGADKKDGIPLYSVTLADQMRKLVREKTSDIMDENEEVRVKKKDGLTMEQLNYLLNVAAKYADETATGASTAIVASLGEDNFLRVLNLGDCACIVIRDSKVVSRSRDIVHYFDCPYQLSVDSPDRPNDGTRMSVEILAGDRILMASDGVFDNMENEDIIDAIDKVPQKASLMAKAVVNASRRISFDKNVETPYSREEKKNYKDATGLGGKLDDVSCVVLQVS